MAKKRADMTARITAAAKPIGNLQDRFAHAEAVLARQPTGFTQPRQDEQDKNNLLGQSPRLVIVPIEQVDPNPYNARRIYRQQCINELALSISNSGQLIPAVATIRDDRYVLVAGHYRLKAIKVAGLDMITLLVHEGLTDQELYQISFKENHDRQEQSALDNALVWRDLLEKGVYANETALAEATGISLPNINKTLQILRLSSRIIDFISQCPEIFAMSALYELVLLEKSAGTQVALQIAEKLATGEVGRKEIQELRARYESPKQRKAKETSRQYKIHFGEIQVGTIKDWDSGKVTLDVIISDPIERMALVQDLKKRFKCDGR